jgi:hypothetical protein
MMALLLVNIWPSGIKSGDNSLDRGDLVLVHHLASTGIRIKTGLESQWAHMPEYILLRGKSDTCDHSVYTQRGLSSDCDRTYLISTIISSHSA